MADIQEIIHTVHSLINLIIKIEIDRRKSYEFAYIWIQIESDRYISVISINYTLRGIFRWGFWGSNPPLWENFFNLQRFKKNRKTKKKFTPPRKISGYAPRHLYVLDVISEWPLSGLILIKVLILELFFKFHIGIWLQKVSQQRDPLSHCPHDIEYLINIKKV